MTEEASQYQRRKEYFQTYYREYRKKNADQIREQDRQRYKDGRHPSNYERTTGVCIKCGVSISQWKKICAGCWRRLQIKTQHNKRDTNE